MTGRVALVALPAPTEPVLRAPAVDVPQERAELVRQSDVGQLVQGADHDRGQVAVDLGVHHDDWQDLPALLVAADVLEPELLRIGRRDVYRPFTAVGAVVYESVRMPLCLARPKAVERAIGRERVGGVASMRRRSR